MSMLSGGHGSSVTMGTSSFRELKKQASFFLREKIKTARLALTDVTPAQLMTEEAASGNSWAPNTQTLGSISKAAFELEDYLRIVDILHKRLAKFEKRNWRTAYNSLIVLEHLLTHGPESVADEFQCDRDVITQTEAFQHIDEKGFNWGLAVRRKSEKVLKLLEKGSVLKEERRRAREVSRGIQGFGSFNRMSSSSSSEQGILQDSPAYRKCNSNFNEHDDGQENKMLSRGEGSDFIQKKAQPLAQKGIVKSQVGEGSEKSLKENMAPEDEKRNGEMNPLLGDAKDGDEEIAEEDDENHPLNGMENKQTVVSLLREREVRS